MIKKTDQPVKRVRQDQGAGAEPDVKVRRPRPTGASGASGSSGSPRAPRTPRGASPEAGLEGAAPKLRRKRPPDASRPVRRPASSASRSANSLEDLGNLMKTKREVNGLTRRDVVMKIKIPLDQLESIEDGRLSTLPPVFAKGFLRAYANELGLDAENILEDYRQMTGGFKNEPASREPLAPHYVESSVGGPRWRPGPRTIVIGLLLIVALAAIWWLKPMLWESASSDSEGQQQESLAEQSTTGSSGVAPLSMSASNAPVSSLGEDTVTGALSSPPPAASSALPQPELKGGVLTILSQRDNVWVQVVVDGHSPEFMVLKSGDTVTWVAEESITVTSGLANALMVTWDGNDLGLLSDGPIAEVRFPQVPS